LRRVESAKGGGSRTERSSKKQSKEKITQKTGNYRFFKWIRKGTVRVGVIEVSLLGPKVGIGESDRPPGVFKIWKDHEVKA